MASEGSSGIYRISKLKGAENYDFWKEEIQSILTLNKLWLVVVGKETSSTEPGQRRLSRRRQKSRKHTRRSS